MEAEFSLPFLQEPAAGPYSEEDESVPHTFSLTRYILIMFSLLRLDLPSELFP
jgi:hypothetical protein